MTEHKHTNRLIHETSPYLLQHAHNPVDWYAWSEEAFADARANNKPLLLSIGYSACHWCHVMEHESFENEAIARLMNENFVCIKVDREERPDLDQIYMNAVQMMTQHGGWPMTVFLTPDGVPFYGGTYFPPADRYNMPGFPRVLVSVSQAYREQPDNVAQTGAALLEELRRMNLAKESHEPLTPGLLDAAQRAIARNYDSTNGGFGGAPKFPPSMNLEFLLRTYHRTGEQSALEIVSNTCRKMAEGGIYDQLGGGFHRYSTDALWLVPHFEKMLYDNALLARHYLHYYQCTGEELARRTVEETLDYVVREMTSPAGGFYSTQDADSEGHEGKFFVWTVAEISEALGTEDAALFCAYYNVSSLGNFEDKNILNVSRSLAEVAKSENVSIERLQEAIRSGRQKLFEIREQRIKPDRDEKILTAWNGLMLASFAEAAAILERDDYEKVARANARFVLENLYRDGLLLRTCKDGEAKLNAYLEDYAFLADGLLALFEATGDFEWFDAARDLANTMLTEFWDDVEGGFFFTGKSHEQLIVRSKDYFDNATPSGNSVAIEVLLKLSTLTGNEDYKRRAVSVLRSITEPMRRFSSGFGRALCGLDYHLATPKEIVILGSSDSKQTASLKREVWKRYLPNKVVVAPSAVDENRQQDIPLLSGRSLINNQPTAFVCEQATCQLPVTDARTLAAQLSE